MNNPILKYMADFDAKYSAIAKKILAEIIDQIGMDTDPLRVGTIINAVFKKYNVTEELKTALMDSIIKSIAVGAGIKTIKNPLAVKKWFLSNVYSASGVKFSQQINDLNRTDEMINVIKKSLKVGTAWRMSAQNLSDRHIQLGDVAGDVNDLLQRARQAYTLAGDPEGYRIYRAEVGRVQRRINNLVEPSTSKLKRSYQDVVDLTADASKRAIANAEKYSVYFKQRYNANRIVHTESSRAYGQGKKISALSNFDIVGFQSILSQGHDRHDVCNLWAEADAYGMGKGIYPKSHCPPYPYHPWCHCMLIEVYSVETMEASGDDFDPDAMQKYIEDLPEDKRKSLLGKGGSQQFADDPGSWEKLVNNYEAPEKVSIKNLQQVEKALYGK